MSEQCSFCRKTRLQVRFLIAGPTAMICEHCVEGARDAVDAGATATDKPCSFCDDRPARSHYAGGDAQICATCIELCVGIIAEKQAPRPLPTAKLLS